MEPTVSVSIEAGHAPIMEELLIGNDSVALSGPQEHYSNDDPLCAGQPYTISWVILRSTMKAFSKQLAIVSCVLRLFVFLPSCMAQSQSDNKDYVPNEMQVADPEVKTYLDSADTQGKNGEYEQAFLQLQKAFDLCVKKNLHSDKALLEAKIAASYVMRGDIEHAKQYWLSADADSVAVGNLVLQADAVEALSGIAKSYQKIDEALELATQALEIARKSKNLWIQSHCLGELGNLQLTMGKTSDARASVEEALRIDRLNQYDFESSHLLYLAWITFVENRDLDQAIQLATSARDLAIKQENYLVFMQASTSLAHGYAQKGKLDQAIALIEKSRDGLTDQGQQLFTNPTSYRAATSLPLIKVSFLEALAFDYQVSKRPDDALKTWQAVYEVAKSASFNLATAEAANGAAIIYQAKKESSSAIAWFALAGVAWEKAGNADREMDALGSEAFLLSQNAQSDKALQVDETLLQMAKARRDLRREFIDDLAIAEIAEPKGDEERSSKALLEAESLLSSDLTLQGVAPGLIAELYARLAAFYGKNKDELKQVIALEKEMTPVEVENKPDTSDLMLYLDQEIKKHLDALNALQTANTAYEGGDLITALLYFELLQHYQQTVARWKDLDYNKNLDDPLINKLIDLTLKLPNQPGGAKALEDNLEQLGPVVQAARLPILIALTNYYMWHNQPDEVIKVATAAWPSLRLHAADNPQRYDVQLSCGLAISLLLKKDIPNALRRIPGCLSSAKAFGDPELLIAAHEANLSILEAAGKQESAVESEQFLLTHSTQDPDQLLEVAKLKQSQGNFGGAFTALQQALHLLDAKKETAKAALVNRIIAQLLSTGKVSDADGEYGHLAKAMELYKQLGDVSSQVEVSVSLGSCFTRQKDSSRAHEYFDSALKLARHENNVDLEASVLSAAGESYRSFGDPAKALASFRSAAKIYHDKDEAAKEASALRNEANIIGFDMHSPKDALELALSARQLSDLSGDWLERYSVRRLIAEIDSTEGDYQGALVALRDARGISESANQPLNTAWVDLERSGTLIDLGEWQEALDAINTAVPVLQRFNDAQDEVLAYADLIDIYGQRESESKDFDKALEYYESAQKLISQIDPGSAASLALSVEEIYWQQGRFKEAIAKGQEALAYWKSKKNIAAEANSLLSLAEAERSVGDVQAATTSLAQAEPLVKQTGDFYMTGRFYYGQANLNKQEGRLQDAIAQYQHVISSLEEYKANSGVNASRSVAETYNYIYGELIDGYYLLSVKEDSYRISSAEKALEYAELNKSRTLISAWGHSFEDALRQKVPADLQQTERDILARRDSLHSELSQLTSNSGHRTVKQIQSDLQQVDAEDVLLRDKLRQSSPAYAEIRHPKPVAIADLPLRPGEVLVEFNMFDPALFVWILEGSPSGTHLVAFYKVAHNRQWFEERILDVRNTFNRGDPSGFNPKLSEELFQALFPEQYTHTLLSADSIIFVPDDILFLLPFEILSPNASENKYVLAKMPTSYFPSAAALRLSRTITPAQREWSAQFLGIADPITTKDDERYLVAQVASAPDPTKKAEEEADKSTPEVKVIPTRSFTTRGYFFDRLPETATEVANIASLFPRSHESTTVRMGMDATKADLLRTDLSRFRFVHFATHGFLPVESSDGEPALILSYDGDNQNRMMFKMSEILALNLHSDMVVLSACNTGSGKVTRAEGVASLGSAFLAAGSSSVTVSLWEVSDKSTAILMQEYYRNLLSGMPKNKALAAARMFLIAQGNSNPFYWAPFVLTGE
jgi:CHAT domain-containing protein